MTLPKSGLLQHKSFPLKGNKSERMFDNAVDEKAVSKISRGGPDVQVNPLVLQVGKDETEYPNEIIGKCADVRVDELDRNKEIAEAVGTHNP